MPLPLALTDDQLDTLIRCASALQRADRDRFLHLVAEGLAGVTELGDGVLHRCMRSVMAEVLRQHPVEVSRMPPKHAREWVRKRRRGGGHRHEEKGRAANQERPRAPETLRTT